MRGQVPGARVVSTSEESGVVITIRGVVSSVGTVVTTGSVGGGVGEPGDTVGRAVGEVVGLELGGAVVIPMLVGEPKLGGAVVIPILVGGGPSPQVVVTV